MTSIAPRSWWLAPIVSPSHGGRDRRSLRPPTRTRLENRSIDAASSRSRAPSSKLAAMTENRVDLYSLTDTITPWAGASAATLGLADLIAAGTTTLDELAAATKADPDALHRLPALPLGPRRLQGDRAAVYALTEAAEFLKTDHPAAQRPWLDVDSMAGRIEGTFSSLTH